LVPVAWSLAAASFAHAAPVQLPTGRLADPAGRITPLGSFPTGAAISPDGRIALVIAGAPIQGGFSQGPIGSVAIDVVDLTTGVVRQALTVGDAFQSVVFTRDGTRAFVAGGTDGVVHVFDVGAGDLVTAAPDLQVGSFVAGLALAPDQRTLWASEPQANKVARVDLGSGTSTTVPAPTPDQLQLSADGRTLYASSWRGKSVTAIPASGGAARSIAVGVHPTGLALAKNGQLLATDSGDATLAASRPADTRASFTSLAQIGRRTDAPNAIAVAPSGRAYVTLGADNAVAVLDPPSSAGRPWRVRGLIPTGWYPVAVTLDPAGRTLAVVTARGLAHGAAATVPYIDPDPLSLVPDGAYGTVGTLEVLPVPDDATLAVDTAQARATLAPRAVSQNPVLAGRRGPIKHVIYVTRENKTYDSVLGDLHPGPGNALVLFGEQVTPNLHAVERQFAESQNFSYQGFASVVGHMWEDTGAVSDVYERGIASDVGEHTEHASTSWSDPENYPTSGLLTQQAWRAGLSVRTYNEELAQQSHLLPAALQADPTVFPNYDLHFPDVRREAGWKTEFDQFESHHCTGGLAAAYGTRCSLPALEYVYLGEDHTTVVDEPGYPTIQAQVADNDAATGRMIDAVSHSPDWPSTLIIVVEDDPQGTGDHLSAYRGLLGIASPWVKRGYVSGVPYDLTSVVGAIDRVLGLPPITDYAQTNRPLDDLFTGTPDYAPFSSTDAGIQRYPFTPLPGVSPPADPAHGVYSFGEPDDTYPPLSNAATWRQVKGTPPPVSPTLLGETVTG
jgi:sugar lactone lactonase YvrE